MDKREREMKKGLKKKWQKSTGRHSTNQGLGGFYVAFFEEYGMGIKKTKRVHSQFQIERNEKM